MLWATYNVGATKPEHYGDYFAWGEIEPKDVYEWSTYKWCNGTETSFTKYCTDDAYGKVDNKIVLEKADDVAYISFGENWRMPTFNEFKELQDNCTWLWVTQNNVKGYRIKSKKNGKSIFLPAGGTIDSAPDYVGVSGLYRSSSLYSLSLEYNEYAGTLIFEANDIMIDYTRRAYGRLVRPVYP